MPDDMNPIHLIKSSIDDVRVDFKDFVKEYHDEILNIWKAITRLQENVKGMARFWGIIGGVIPSLVAIAAAILYLMIKGGGTPTP